MTNETVIAILSRLKECYLGIVVNALDLAIEAVKEQEPRVMTRDEVETLKQNEIVWLEDKGVAEVIPAIMIEHGHCYGQRSVVFMIVENPRLWIVTFDYLERWRCWTSRPTDEQREATPWN